MTIEQDTNGLGVKQQYGPLQTNEARYSEKTRTDSQLEIEVAFRGSDFDAVAEAIPFTLGTVPAGSKLREVLAFVPEAFALGGTTPTINIGTEGSAGTNGVEISEAQAEATGFYDLTGAGTWAAILAADTIVEVILDGTSPTVTAAGEIIVRLSFDTAGV